MLNTEYVYLVDDPAAAFRSFLHDERLRDALAVLAEAAALLVPVLGHQLGREPQPLARRHARGRERARTGRGRGRGLRAGGEGGRGRDGRPAPQPLPRPAPLLILSLVIITRPGAEPRGSGLEQKTFYYLKNKYICENPKIFLF